MGVRGAVATERRALAAATNQKCFFSVKCSWLSTAF